MNDHLSAPVRELLALYAEKYAELRFPDLDLGRLQSSAGELAAALEKVDEAEASVNALREQARIIEADLTQKAARTIAFLKVYIEGDESEYARLDALTLALLTRPRARKPESAGAGERTRGRPKKARVATSTNLDPEDAVSEVSVEQLAEADLPSSALTQLAPVSADEQAAE
ncbi:MAG TPA: hypothetical protein VKP30_07660 [Polyangiaceae bacterium]|nr:hypothetical protein [Polyangiaceae bacterium]